MAALTARGCPPGLAVVLVGNNPASEIYVRNKVRACHDLGIHSESITPPGSITTEDLLASWDRRQATPAVRQLIALEIGRARRHYTAAAPGIPLLARSSQPCIRAAYSIYGGILDEIEAADHDVFARRAVVPTGRRLRLLAKSFLTAPSAPVALPREV